ncbi:MAG TPA: c-type cytochrome [Acidimicrobiia bacterium]|nr:c-type cytochrome [Acidimicrobiia bacterium]
MTVRKGLIIINIIAALFIAGVLVYRVLSARRNPDAKLPQNQRPYLTDAELEGPKLERALGWALWCAVIIAAALPIYWLWEPTRESKAVAGFDKAAVDRGATLFANDTMKAYDPTQSLRCADCHGTDASGGSTTYVLQPPASGSNQPVQVTWRAPALNTVLLRYTPAQVNQIITYGRPGTPMPAWGVAGGGSKNTQSVDDLIAYLQSIQLSPAKAQQQEQSDLNSMISTAQSNVKTARDNLASAQQQLAQDEAALAKNPTDKDLQTAVQLDREDITNAQAAIKNSQVYAQQTQQLVTTWKSGDPNVQNSPAQIAYGNLLFQANCARCHTRGWSYFDPTKGGVPLPSAQGTGAFGPNLTNGAVVDQFPGPEGITEQYTWIADGVEANKQYGVRGISSGRMPHFGTLLSKEQIDAIIAYERSL